jgi:flagellar hook-length control protein FliK
MNVLNSLSTGFTAALGGNHDAGSATQDAGSQDRMFSKWMDNASTQQRAADKPKTSQPQRDKIGERSAQSNTQSEDRAPKATEGNRAAAEAEQASESASADKADERDTDQGKDDTAQDAAWPPPGLAALLLPALPPTNAQTATPADGALPQGELLGAGKSAPQALPTTLGALMAQATGAQPGSGDTAPSSGDTQPTTALPAEANAAQAAPQQQANAPTAAPTAGALALNALPMAARHEVLPADMAAMVATLSVDSKAAAQVADAGADTSLTDVRAAISLTQPAPLATARDVAVVAPPSVVPNLQGDAFPDEIGAHLKWMADQKVGHAHLRVSPDEMGAVDIRLKLDGDRVSADFSATQADVRQALEQSLPRLRELLGQHGFQLAHADVGQGQQSRQQGDGGSRVNTPGGTLDLPEDGAVTTVSVASLRGRGLLDAYA